MGVVGFDQSWSTALGTPAFAAPSNLTLFDVGTLTLSDVMQVNVQKLENIHLILIFIINCLFSFECAVPAGGGQLVGQHIRSCGIRADFEPQRERSGSNVPNPNQCELWQLILEFHSEHFDRWIANSLTQSSTSLC